MNNEIKQLSKKELLRLMKEYNNYIQDFLGNNEGSPVCLDEFYDNEYQKILYVGDRVRFDSANFMENEKIFVWLKNHKAINWTVVEVDKENATFCIEGIEVTDDNKCVKVRCPYAISVEERFRRVLSLEDNCRLVFVDTSGDSEDIEYLVEIDDKFEKNIKKLQKLIKNYESYQVIEDFIYENFTLVNLGYQEFEY